MFLNFSISETQFKYFEKIVKLVKNSIKKIMMKNNNKFVDQPSSTSNLMKKHLD